MMPQKRYEVIVFTGGQQKVNLPQAALTAGAPLFTRIPGGLTKLCVRGLVVLSENMSVLLPICDDFITGS